MTRTAAMLWLLLAATGAAAADLPQLRTPVMADRPVLSRKAPTPSGPPLGSVSPQTGPWHTFARVRVERIASAERIRVIWFPGDDDTRPQAGAITATMRRRISPNEVEIEIPQDAGGPNGGVVRIVAILPKSLKPLFVARFTVGAAVNAPQQAPAPPPKATARLDLRSISTAAFGGGRIYAAGERIVMARYTVIDASSRYYVNINPDAGGRIRVRTTVSNVPGPTTLLLESAQASASCPLVGNPGYHNYQTCDLAFDLPAAREVVVTVHKASDAVGQVTLARFDVTREGPSGAVLAAAQLALSGPAAAGFDNIPSAKVDAAAAPVSNGAHIQLIDNSALTVNLSAPPAGTYRFRAMVSNTAATTRFSMQGGGQQATCDIPATPGYQSAAPCDLVVPVTAAGANLGVILRKQSGGAPTATVDTVYVYQE